MNGRKERAHLIIRKYETENDKKAAFDCDTAATGLDLLEMIAVAVDGLIASKHGRNYDEDEIVAACGAVAMRLHAMHFHSQQTVIPTNIIKEVTKNDGPAN